MLHVYLILHQLSGCIHSRLLGMGILLLFHLSGGYTRNGYWSHFIEIINTFGIALASPLWPHNNRSTSTWDFSTALFPFFPGATTMLYKKGRRMRHKIFVKKFQQTVTLILKKKLNCLVFSSSYYPMNMYGTDMANSNTNLSSLFSRHGEKMVSFFLYEKDKLV